MAPENHKLETSEMKFFCDASCLEKIREFVREKAVSSGFSEIETGKLVLAADEASSNIVKHAYRLQSGNNIYIAWRETPDQAIIEIKDESNEPYLPMGADFNLATKLKYRHISGYGHYMLQQLVDDVHYETTPGSHNKVSLIKLRNKEEPLPETAEDKAENLLTLNKTINVTLDGVLDLSHHLTQERNPEVIVKMYLYGLMGLFSTHPVSFLVPHENSGPFAMAGQVGLSSRILPSDVHLPRYGWLPEQLRIGKGPLLAHSLRNQGIPEEEMAVIDKLRTAVVVPVFLRDHLTAIVFLGRKKNREPFSEDDIRITQMLTIQNLLLWERALRKQAEKKAK